MLYIINLLKELPTGALVPMPFSQFFDEIPKLKRNPDPSKIPFDFVQGPFAGTSPAIAGNYFTQAFFDSVRPKTPQIDNAPVLFTPPVIKANIVEQPFFEPVRLKPILDRFQEAFGVPFLPPVLTTAVWFEALRLLKVPERFTEPQAILPPTPVLVSAFFDVLRKLIPPAGLDWSPPFIAPPPSTITQGILVDWFSLVKLKTPLVETPPVVNFPATAPVVPAQYRLLVDHWVLNTYLPAGTIVTEGNQIPFGWPPTIAVDPLNTQAIQTYWNAGPAGAAGGEHAVDLYNAPFGLYSILRVNVSWVAVPGSPGYFQLTGAGASLGAKRSG